MGGGGRLESYPLWATDKGYRQALGGFADVLAKVVSWKANCQSCSSSSSSSCNLLVVLLILRLLPTRWVLRLAKFAVPSRCSEICKRFGLSG